MWAIKSVFIWTCLGSQGPCRKYIPRWPSGSCHFGRVPNVHAKTDPCCFGSKAWSLDLNPSFLPNSSCLWQDASCGHFNEPNSPSFKSRMAWGHNSQIALSSQLPKLPNSKSRVKPRAISSPWGMNDGWTVNTFPLGLSFLGNYHG